MFSSETPSNFQANPSKANLLKSARGKTKAHKMYTREKHPTVSRTRKESTKIYKARDIKKGINIEPLIEGFKETEL